MRRRSFLWILLLISSLTFWGCSGGQGLNLFSPQDDVALGKQVKEQIASDPQQFPILPEQGNEEAYSYIRGLTNRILNTGKVSYRDEFAWEVYIIDDDETLNAFCTPGGYIYVYTGLIKYLDAEDELAGVMGHEIAHAAQRHSTRQLTKIYGLQVLAALITGQSDPGLMQEIALGLASLKFSRDHETEADTYSVVYLCETNLNAAGAAGFFEKMQGRAQPPQFLSTHPSPGNRVENIREQARDLNCPGTNTNDAKYQQIKSLL